MLNFDRHKSGGRPAHVVHFTSAFYNSCKPPEALALLGISAP